MYRYFNFLLLSVICVLILSFPSCGDDSTRHDLDLNEPFYIDVNILKNNFFVIATNQDNEVLFDTMGNIYDQRISFIKAENDIVNLSYGWEEGRFVNRTFMDVPYGFKLNDFQRDCNDDFYTNAEIKNFKLDIVGIDEYLETHSPFVFLTSSNFYINDKQLTLEGILSNEEDVFLTLRIANNEYKSILITQDQWVNVNSEDVELTLNYSDFATPQIHKIVLQESAAWKVYLTAKRTDGTVISLLKSFKTDQLQEGSFVNVFRPDDSIELSYKLEVSSQDLINGFFFKSALSQLPSRIELFEANLKTMDINSSGFNVSSDADYDLFKMVYYYSLGGQLSAWEVYSLAKDEITFELPTIPETYLEEYDAMQELIDSPEEWSAQFYKMDDKSALLEIYNRESVDVNLRCIDFSSHIIGGDF